MAYLCSKGVQKSSKVFQLSNKKAPSCGAIGSNVMGFPVGAGAIT